MASGWFANKAIELIRARSLFVNVSPAPTSLSERRAVLHALQKHGQIEVFKSLPVSCRYSPSQLPPELTRLSTESRDLCLRSRQDRACQLVDQAQPPDLQIRLGDGRVCR